MYRKKIKEEVRPCVRCKTNHLIYDRMKWLCQDCAKEVAQERKGDLRGLFQEIWDERPHYCNHCGQYLGSEPRASFFAHIKSRGSHPELKMDKANIVLLCQECHYALDFQSKERYEERKDINRRDKTSYQRDC